MAKFTDDSVLDAALAKVATATRLTICSTQPANFAGIAAVKLGEVTMTAGSGNGDYVLANGDVSGRKLRVLAQSAVPLTASGTFGHVCLDDGATLLHATTGTGQSLTSGNTANVPEWDVEFLDVTS